MPHIHEKVDFCVEVFIVHNNKVLLRMHDKYHIWLSIGGHIELHEDPNQAALREVQEEVGLNVQLADDLLPKIKGDTAYKELIPPKFMNRHRINDTHEHVALVYFARSSTDKIQQNVKEEHSDHIRWWTKEEILASPDLKEKIKVYALRALDELREK